MKALPLPAVLVVALIPLPLACQDVTSDAPGRLVCQESLAALDPTSRRGPHLSDSTPQDLPPARDCAPALIRLPHTDASFRGSGRWFASTRQRVGWARAPPARHLWHAGVQLFHPECPVNGFPTGGL
jgi:hypothetical protein